MTATPMLVFGAISTGIVRAALSSSAALAASKPVAPTSKATRRSRHASRVLRDALRQAEVDGHGGIGERAPGARP